MIQARGLTIWQPWASAIACGAKRIETRDWLTNYRGLVLIHAAKRFDQIIVVSCEAVSHAIKRHGYQPTEPDHRAVGYWRYRETLGAVLAAAWLWDCRPMLTANSDLERDLGHFGPGRYGWEFKHVAAVDRPIHVSGAQGLWAPSADLVDEVFRSLTNTKTKDVLIELSRGGQLCGRSAEL